MATFIDYIPRITLSNLKELIKRQSETDATLCARFTLKGIQYTAVAFLNKNEMLFYWDYEGERRKVIVALCSEPSNLGKGQVWYFLCPYTGRKCRTLFLNGKVIASRYAFCHVYSYQNESKRNRIFRGCGKIDTPERKYGKKMYKGKLTPYGRKVDKYYSKLHRFTVMLENCMLIPKLRGRKPKGERAIGFFD